MKKLLTVTLALAMMTGLSACGNTWHGAGQDVENIGKEMQS